MIPSKNLKLWDIDTLHRVVQRLNDARMKHPDYAADPEDAFKVVEAEFKEFDHAHHHETPLRAEDEALDVIVTAIRYINREYQRNVRQSDVRVDNV